MICQLQRPSRTVSDCYVYSAVDPGWRVTVKHVEPQLAVQVIERLQETKQSMPMIGKRMRFSCDWFVQLPNLVHQSLFQRLIDSISIIIIFCMFVFSFIIRSSSQFLTKGASIPNNILPTFHTRKCGWGQNWTSFTSLYVWTIFSELSSLCDLWIETRIFWKVCNCTLCNSEGLLPSVLHSRVEFRPNLAISALSLWMVLAKLTITSCIFSSGVWLTGVPSQFTNLSHLWGNCKIDNASDRRLCLTMKTSCPKISCNS